TPPPTADVWKKTSSDSPSGRMKPKPRSFASRLICPVAMFCCSFLSPQLIPTSTATGCRALCDVLHVFNDTPAWRVVPESGSRRSCCGAAREDLRRGLTRAAYHTLRRTACLAPPQQGGVPPPSSDLPR